VKKLSDIIKAVKDSGVYLLAEGVSTNDVEKFALENGFTFFLLNGKQISGKGDFLTRAASALSFPDYFGNNWDAFEDCLTDMSWHEARGYVLLFDDFGPFADQSPDEFHTALEILKDSASFWANGQKVFVALLRGPSRKSLDLPVVITP
jgi:RNAse (barnase) inhibitor barstar